MNAMVKHKCIYHRFEPGNPNPIEFCQTHEDRCPEKGGAILAEDIPNDECGWSD